ncbi:hypothetical protein NE237_014404 [Protea cynaroides]|uniref:Glycosyltransferase n=1 Tax=Protea cynaroides TaxID=273540 RepID=A0A9Q0KBY5_9MAGN|nr:hypothetical protein NE237_014404 [Protea cynaroides]
MEPIVAEKPHAVCIPYPAQGHVTPMMQLAKILHTRGFHITFVNTEYNHRRLLRSNGPDAVKGLRDFRFETIPDGLPPDDGDVTQDVPSLCNSVQKNCLAPLLHLIKKLNSSSDVPGVSCIISDGVMSCGLQAAKALGIQGVQFWTTSACGFMTYLHCHELKTRGISPLRDDSDISNGYYDTPIDWIPGMKDIRLKDLPTFTRKCDPNDFMLGFMGQEALDCLQASAIILNTFDDLEFEVLSAIAFKYAHIYTIGPLPMLDRHILKNEMNLGTSLWKEDSKCLKWLDEMELNSVLYVNFGSITFMTNQHLIEFAWGLANSKHPFLWIVRPDVVIGESAILPEDFIEETKDRGLLASWCPQERVLSHSSVGGFLTHCGWNSTTESICGGVPILCWPFFAEQQPNCRYACTTWGIGMEIGNDVKREEVQTLIKDLLEGEKGNTMRKNVSEWKEKAEAATQQGGSSYSNFDRLISEVLQPDTVNNM